MQACVSLLAACVSLLVDVHSLNGEDTFRTADNNPLLKMESICYFMRIPTHAHSLTHFETHFDTDVFVLNTVKRLKTF